MSIPMKSMSLALFTFCLCLPAQEAMATPTRGLANSWQADGNATHSQGIQGILKIGAAFAPRKFGPAFSLNGVDDRMFFKHNVKLKHAGAFSVMSWIKADPAQFSPVGIFMVIHKWHGFSGFKGWDLAGRKDAVRKVRNGTGSLGASIGMVIRDGQRHHLAGVFDGSQLRIYLDGNLRGRASAGHLVNNKGGLFIGVGWRGGAINRNFHGLIDELVLYDRALSESEIQNVIDPVPEPSTLFLLGAGLAGLAAYRRKRRR